MIKNLFRKPLLFYVSFIFLVLNTILILKFPMLLLTVIIPLICLFHMYIFIYLMIHTYKPLLTKNGKYYFTVLEKETGYNIHFLHSTSLKYLLIYPLFNNSGYHTNTYEKYMTEGINISHNTYEIIYDKLKEFQNLVEICFKTDELNGFDEFKNFDGKLK